MELTVFLLIIMYIVSTIVVGLFLGREYLDHRETYTFTTKELVYGFACTFIPLLNSAFMFYLLLDKVDQDTCRVSIGRD